MSVLRGKSKAQRMQLFAWTCLKLAGKAQAQGDAVKVSGLCKRADHFFECAEAAKGGVA